MVPSALLISTLAADAAHIASTPSGIDQERHYAETHELRRPALKRLNTGMTKPCGWLRDELQLQAKGISSQLPRFWPFLNASSWVSTSAGFSPAQYIPYYLNGLVPLSFQLDEPALTALRTAYVDYILSHQHRSGWLGHEVPRNATAPSAVPGGANEYWPKYLALSALESHAEASPPAESQRVVQALVRHMAAFWDQASTHSPAINASHWGYVRYEEAIVAIHWLIDHGQGRGDTAFLWDLMRLIREESDATMAAVDHTWTDFWTADASPFQVPDGWSPNWYTGRNPDHRPDVQYATVHALRHGADIGEAMKTGVLNWRSTGSQTDFYSAQAALQWVERYLHMSDGMFFADEEVEGSNSPSRGTETCSTVEMMYSMRTAYEITGNITFMDRLERLAFNALPAALWPDVTSNACECFDSNYAFSHNHHSSNQLFAVGAPFGYHLWFCCTSNVHQGWPKFVMSAVHIAEDDVVVVSGYAPSVSTVPKVGLVNISGRYPWSDTAFIELDHAAQLRLRVPCWVDSALITLSGAKNFTTASPCSFASIYTPAKTKLNVTFINRIRVHTWRNSSLDGQGLIQPGGVEVHRGPLLFALRPASQVVETPAKGAKEAGANISLKDTAVHPDAKWNYALVLDTLQFIPNAGPVPSVPFSATASPPVKISVTARLVPGWGSRSELDKSSGLQACSRPEEHSMHCGVDPLPASPVNTTEPAEKIELVPYGSTNLRISVFPTALK